MDPDSAVILQKVEESPLLKEFLLKVSVKEFEEYVNFEIKGMSIHRTYKCPEHGKIFEYGQHRPEDADFWYSGDTEFERGHFNLKQYFKQKYPCCEEVYESTEDGEEDVCFGCGAEEAKFCEKCDKYFCYGDDECHNKESCMNE